MDKADRSQRAPLNRRAFMQQGTLFLAGSTLAGACGFAPAEGKDKPKVRIGLVTDLHYADKPPSRSRHYRETLTKLAEAAKRFEEEKVDCFVELGDSVDAEGSRDGTNRNLKRIAKEFAATSGQHHYVLGNHCVHDLTKPEFLEIVGRERSFYSFDLGGYHFVVLDACFRSDGVPYGRRNFHVTDTSIPPMEVEWLRVDLKQTSLKAVVFVHQQLDVDFVFGITNAPQIRKILEESGRVLAVFQGHLHHNFHSYIGGVHYCTLTAMVEGSGPENNAYAVMDIVPGDAIRIRGFRKQESYRCP